MIGHPWVIVDGQQPIAATAIHDGHELRPEVEALMAIGSRQRLQEEDPGTSILASVGGTQVVVTRSRFEVDLNRPRETAVYVTPAQAWGLDVWVEPPGEDVIARSLELYDEFYAEAHLTFTAMAERYGRFVVLDVHSYNHRRGGPDAAPDDPTANPEINVGTGTVNRQLWGGLVDRFQSDLREQSLLGRAIDVRENVKFRGGHFSTWIHENFPDSACCLAIEFKKIYMDEWSGKFAAEELEGLSQALAATVPGILDSLEAMKPREPQALDPAGA